MKRLKELAWGRIYLWIFRPLYQIESLWYPWRLVNHRAVRHWKRYGWKELPPVQKRILADLEDAGIAVTSLEELYGNGDQTLAALQRWKEGLPGHTSPHKTYITDYIDTVCTIDLAWPLSALTLDDRILALAGNYLGMSPKLQELALAEIRELPEGTQKTGSMRWHRDPHDRRLFKMFVYLSDVNPENGPFSYVRYSARGGKYANLFPQKPPAGFYPPPGAVEKAVDPKDIQLCTGKAGTIIFADTAGFHGGGYVTKGHRLMSTAAFLPPKSFLMRWVQYAGEPQALPPLQLYALLGDERLLSRNLFRSLKRALLGKESFGTYGTYF